MKNKSRPPIRIWQEVLLLFIFNTLIAAFLTLAQHENFIKNLIFSQSIGISIYLCIKLIIHSRAAKKGNLISQLIGVPVGGVIGIVAGALLSQTPLSDLLDFRQNELILLLGAAIVFGTAISYFFLSRHRLHAQQLELHAQAQQHSEYQKNLMQSQLRLLQAQIEPHFLFNALANVVSLIDAEPEKAKQVIQQLSDFLRISLQRTRDNNNTVADEINLLRAYLGIQQVRMGDRLQFSIECESALLMKPLSPLLVQPLVENAIKHGLENTVSGGRVKIKFKQQQNQLLISVIDSGQGVVQPCKHGMGLNNIRERLKTLYGNSARMTLSENDSGGVKACLTVPLTS